jgi:hypothetical protein
MPTPKKPSTVENYKKVCWQCNRQLCCLVCEEVCSQ